jgi:hypothetical protein
MTLTNNFIVFNVSVVFVLIYRPHPLNGSQRQLLVKRVGLYSLPPPHTFNTLSPSTEEGRKRPLRMIVVGYQNYRNADVSNQLTDLEGGKRTSWGWQLLIK